MPNNAAVTVVKMKNFTTGTREICAQRLITKAVEQPMIKRPPIISPQRMLLCSMNAARTSANGLRGGFGIGSAGRAFSESCVHAPNCGPGSPEGVCSKVVGVMKGAGAVTLGPVDAGGGGGLLVS